MSKKFELTPTFQEATVADCVIHWLMNLYHWSVFY